MSTADKLGRGIGNLMGGVISKLQTFLYGQFLYVMLYVVAFIAPVIVIELLIMQSNETFSHLLMLPLALFTFLPVIFWHWPISWVTVGFGVGTAQAVSLIVSSFLAAIGHLLSLLAYMILIPFLVFAKFMVVILALVTDNATTPNTPNPLSINDILNLRVNNCNGPVPVFLLGDYYVLSTMKNLIDLIGGASASDGIDAVLSPVTNVTGIVTDPVGDWADDQWLFNNGATDVVGDTWDWLTGETTDKPVRDLPGLGAAFDWLDYLFTLELPPSMLFTPIFTITDLMFGWAFGDYSGMELMNEALYIKRLDYNSKGTLVEREEGYFEGLFETIVAAFLGCD